VIKAIIFDLGGVLLQDPSADMIRYYTNRLQVNREPFVEALNKLRDAWHKGHITERRAWEQLTTDLKISSVPEESLWLKGWLHGYKENPGMFALVKQLKQQGYMIALLSNTEPPIMNYLKQKPFEDIDLYLCSCEVGAIKPEQAIYETMLQRLGVQPQEAVFIDDLAENVEGAMRLGIPSILFCGSEDLKKQFRRLGINL